MGAHQIPREFLPSGFPEPEQWNGQDDRPMPSAQAEQDEAREHDWAHLDAELCDFAKLYGWPATLRCVASAMQGQLELFR
jgi:hypothetical protein